VAALLPAVAWAGVFGGALVPRDAGHHDLVVVQHNVSDVNPDPAGTARALAATGAGLIALEEVVPGSLPAYAAALGGDHPHSTVQGTVALWSRYPLAEARLVDIRPAAFGPDWNRALRAVARTPWGDVAVHVAHLPSVRFGTGGFDADRRDESAARWAPSWPPSRSPGCCCWAISTARPTTAACAR
jgi:vancomycin resistance protein VanJ